MKTIIAGGRDYMPDEEAMDFLDSIKDQITEVVSGGAKGADRFGEVWAGLNEIPIKKFEAQWAMYGKSAGPRRNKQMALYADALVLFPGGRGTDNMYENAQKYELKIFDRRNK